MTFIKIFMFAVFCLPFSLMNSLAIFLPFSTIITHPTLLTLLHLLCTAQFSLNFIVYTILAGPAGNTYSALLSRARVCLSSVLTRPSSTTLVTSIRLSNKTPGESQS